MAKKKVDLKKVRKDFIQSMKKVANLLGKAPREVTMAEFQHNDPLEINYSHLKSAGGFTNLKKMYFETVDDAVVKHGSRLIERHRNRLEKRFGEEVFWLEEVKKVLADSLKKNPLKVHKPIAKAKKSKAKTERTVLAHFSDTHFGANIIKPEVGGLNEFNWKIASRRAAYFAEQLAMYKRQYRNETELVLCINGDIIAGMIHNQEWFADLLTIQFVGTLKILVQMISYLAREFKQVRVFCTTGNHGRAMHKESKQRATTQKWDSYESMIFTALKEVLNGACKNVNVDIPKAPFCIVKAQGHNFFQTHGDTVINVGDPGKSLNMKEINNQINKLNASELGGEEHFAGILVGHVHTPTVQLTESGCMLVINGCLSGLDPFAQSIGIFTSNPTQQIFEVTKKHAVGDMRFIQVKTADNRADLDKIIEPYNGKL